MTYSNDLPLWRVHFSMSLSAAYTSTRSNPLEPTLCFSSKIVGSCLHPLSMPSWLQTCIIRKSGRATSMNGYHTFSRTFTFYRSWRLLLCVLSRTFRNSCRNICWLKCFWGTKTSLGSTSVGLMTFREKLVGSDECRCDLINEISY